MTAVLDGLGVAVPERTVTNAELAHHLDTSDEWIRARTGIAQRRIADADTATSDLAADAGRAAMKRAGTTDVDVVIVATTTPDHPMPGVAPLVAARLGLGPVAAYDVQAVCSGFVYALATASGLLSTGVADRALVIGAEVMSRVVDPEDRGTAVLFGDGAGAVTLRRGAPGEPGAVGPFDLGSDGDQATDLYIDAGGSRRPRPGDHGDGRYLYMDGRQVYRQAVRRMTESSLQLLDRAGLTVDDIDRFVAHQANLRILMAVADRLGVPAERRVSNVHRYGNTSAASIPLALADADLRAGQRILLTSFGSGFTWGSTVLTWPDLDQ